MKNAKRIYLAIIVICLAIIFPAIYYVLGGFEKPEVFAFEGEERTIIGKHYIGKYRPKQVNGFLQEVKTLVDSGKLQGKVTLVEYKDDAIGRDSTHLFIGASIDEIRSILEIPSGFTFEEFRTKQIYRVFITQNVWVRPQPTEIRTLIEVRSIQDGNVLAPYTFDVYYEDGSLCTEAWVK